MQEARSLLDFRRNFSQDPNVLIPEVYQEYCSANVLVMEWVDGIRCTDPTAFESEEAKRRFITIGVESGMKQLLEFGLFHGDPHPVRASLATSRVVYCVPISPSEFAAGQPAQFLHFVPATASCGEEGCTGRH